MTTVQLVIICLTVLLLALVAAAVLIHPYWPRRSASDLPALGTDVALQLGGGVAIAGTLERAGGPVLVLGSPRLLTQGREQPIAGRARVFRSRVEWVQEL